MKPIYSIGLIAVLMLAGCSEKDTSTGAEIAATESPQEVTMSAAPKATDALEITDIVVGEGPEIQAGQTAVVHYTGWLYEEDDDDHRGNKFDSSVDRGPFRFALGARRVIIGWDEGVAGMQVGGKRILVVPPHMAYGARGASDTIPPNATLVFEVELLGIE